MPNESVILDLGDVDGGPDQMDVNGDTGEISGAEQSFNTRMESSKNDEFSLDGNTSLDSIGDNQVTDKDYSEGPLPKKRARPAFHKRSVKLAERAALRTNADDIDPFVLEEEAKLSKATPPRVPGSLGRYKETKGTTLPAYHKKISHELDSDDELMISMREQGFSDREISEKLAKDGRVRYDVKSVSTRIQRLRAAQVGRVDLLLKEGLKEWKFEEDQLLMQAYDKADIEVRCEIERMLAWRWRKVSDHMRRVNNNAVFSAEACRERYAALLAGTATIPSAVDDDPEARVAEMEAHKLKRKAEREAEEAEKFRKAEEKRRIKEEARARIAAKNAATLARQERLIREKRDRARRNAAAAQARADAAVAAKKAREDAIAAAIAQKAAKKAAGEAKRKAIQDEKDRKHRKANKNVTYSRCGVAIAKDIKPDTPDPRSFLSEDDIKKLCAKEGVSAEGTKDEMVLRLAKKLHNLRIQDLKNLCKKRKIKPGTKIVMKYQLALQEAKQCESFEDDEE